MAARVTFCVVASAAPLALAAACVDLGNLANQPAADDSGAEGRETGTPEIEGGLPESKCPPGQKSCAGGCVLNNLPEYGCAADSCERCSVSFAETVICESGKCAAGTCQQGRGSCDANKENGCEADFTLAATCGACTSACPMSAALCAAGQCVAECQAGTLQCGTQCVDPMTSATNCGRCGNVCPPAANGTGACVAGACTVKCSTGFDDCDGNLANGCESRKPYYRDADGDGVGGGPIVDQACVAPAGHSLVAGDCLDTNDKVKPGQTSFFYTGYTNANGLLSYDYDCNGNEQPEPSKLLGSCNTCRAGDFTTVQRSSPPPGANMYCGSSSAIVSCSASCAVSSASAVGCR